MDNVKNCTTMFYKYVENTTPLLNKGRWEMPSPAILCTDKIFSKQNTCILIVVFLERRQVP